MSEVVPAKNGKMVNRTTVPVVRGMLYDEEERKCPLCSEQAMWYFFPDDQEILACPNPTCQYPCDDVNPYIIRKRDHGLTCIEGPPTQIAEEEVQTSLVQSGESVELPNLSIMERADQLNRDLAQLEGRNERFASIGESENAQFIPGVELVKTILKGIQEVEEKEQNLD